MAHLWDVATGRECRRALVRGGAITAVTFSPDGRLLLTGSDDRTSRLWEAATGRPLGRHCVKSGITGWAQVHGWRGNTSLRKRVQFDLYYITHWTPWLDLRILWMTLFHGSIHRNAY